jgi:hypothetical protein
MSGTTTRVIAGLAVGIAFVLLFTFSLNPHHRINNDHLASAGMEGGRSHCMSTEQVRRHTKFAFVEPPNQIDSRTLRCAEGEATEVRYVYAPNNLSSSDDITSRGQMQKDNTMLLFIQDTTLGGTLSHDLKAEIRHTFEQVQEKRPDLKPQLLTINGHLAWGREGGGNVGRVVVEDSNHTALSTTTEQEPALLDMELNGKVGYHLEALAPLSELISAAKTLSPGGTDRGFHFYDTKRPIHRYTLAQETLDVSSL